jgi:hypothetical protein
MRGSANTLALAAVNAPAMTRNRLSSKQTLSVLMLQPTTKVLSIGLGTPDEE